MRSSIGGSFLFLRKGKGGDVYEGDVIIEQAGNEINHTGELTRMHKKTVLLTVAWDNTDSAFDVVKAYYKRICEYMNFKDQGMVIGKGCGTTETTKRSKYMDEAYRLGKNI